MRFINAGAMTHFDVRIPGLEMTLLQADGQNVESVSVDELAYMGMPGDAMAGMAMPKGDAAARPLTEAMRGVEMPSRDATAMPTVVADQATWA